MTFGDEIRQLLIERAFHQDRVAAIDAQLADARAALTAPGDPQADRRPFSRLALLGVIGEAPKRTGDLICTFDATETRLRAELKGLEAHAHIIALGKGTARRWGITSLGRQLLQRAAQSTSAPSAPAESSRGGQAPGEVVVFSGRDSLIGDRPGYRSAIADC